MENSQFETGFVIIDSLKEETTREQMIGKLMNHYEIDRDTAVYLFAFMKINKMQGYTLDEALKMLTRKGYGENVLSYVRARWDGI